MAALNLTAAVAPEDPVLELDAVLELDVVLAAPAPDAGRLELLPQAVTTTVASTASTARAVRRLAKLSFVGIALSSVDAVINRLGEKIIDHR